MPQANVQAGTTTVRVQRFGAIGGCLPTLSAFGLSVLLGKELAVAMVNANINVPAWPCSRASASAPSASAKSRLSIASFRWLP